MKPEGCPSESELFALLDEPIEGGAIAKHVANCETCTAASREIAQLLADAREPVRTYPSEPFVARLTAALHDTVEAPSVVARAAVPAPTVRRLRPAFAAAVAGALAIAAMVVLVPDGLFRDQAGVFTARGQRLSEAGAMRDVDLTLDVVTRSPSGVTTLAPPSRDVAIAPAAHLLLSFATRSAAADFYVLCFAIDEAGEVHWLYPAYESASVDPTSVVLPAGKALTPLGTEALLDQIPPGAVRVVALVSPRPHRVSEIEKLAPSEREPAQLGRHLVDPDADVRTWELRVAPSRGATP